MHCLTNKNAFTKWECILYDRNTVRKRQFKYHQIDLAEITSDLRDTVLLVRRVYKYTYMVKMDDDYDNEIVMMD